MGSWWSLKIGELTVETGKSDFDPWVSVLFTQTEKRSGREKLHEDDDDDFEFFRYEVSGTTLAQRLDVLGFTLAKSLANIEEAIEDQLSEGGQIQEALGGIEPEWLGLLRSFDLRQWRDALAIIVARNLRPYDKTKRPPDIVGTAAERLLDLLCSDNVFPLGLPSTHTYFILRTAIDALPGDTFIVLEASEVVSNGYEDAEADHRDLALSAFAGNYVATAPVILLTEGSTDTRALELSLSILFPHMRDFFVFLDFGGPGLPGGASQLVSHVRSLAAARIPNRLLAIFDNDRAGRSECERLRSFSLPEHYGATVLPDIAIARDYPCLGPSGASIQNVNGRACSIELYFGRDVLTLDGALVPVRWTGFDPKSNDYQGEVERKRELSERFVRKAKLAHDNLEPTADSRWREMVSVWRHIFALCEEL